MQESGQEPQPRIAWADLFPFTPLFRSFSLACQPTQLLLALVTVVLIYAVGVVLDAAWPARSLVAVERNDGGIVRSELSAYIESRQNLTVVDGLIAAVEQREPDGSADLSATRHGIFATLLGHLRLIVYEATDALFNARLLTDDAGRPGLFAALWKLPQAVSWLFQLHYVYGTLFLLLTLAIMGFFGGAMYRVAAVNATRREAIDPSEAIGFARQRFFSFFTAPLFPWAAILFFGFVNFLGGLLACLPVLDFLAGLVWFLPLLGGALMALAFIVSLFVWPLLHPAIAVEGTESFDAFARGSSYFIDKRIYAPVLFLLATAYGLVCLFVVKFVVRIALWFTHYSVGLGMNLWSVPGAADGESTGKLDAIWAAPTSDLPFFGEFGHVPLSGTAWAASGPIWLWTMLFVLLIAAFVLSFFCTASTNIYLLLRREVDGNDLEDVWTAEEEADLAADADATPAAEPTSESPAPTVAASPKPDAGESGGAA